MYKKIVSLMLSLCMIVGLSLPAYAIEGYTGTNNIPGETQSNITLNVGNTGETFTAYIPTELPIQMDLDGNIVTATEAKIINASDTKDIKVSGVEVELGSGWSAANFEDDFTSKADNTQEIGIKLRSDTLSSDGTFSLTEDDWKIGKESSLDLNMGVKIPKQTVEGDKGKIATVTFTLEYADGSGSSSGSGGSGSGGSGSSTIYTVTFESGENGTIGTPSSLQVASGSTISIFPVTNPTSGYIFDKWINTLTNEEVTSGLKPSGNVKIVLNPVSDTFTAN